MVRGEANPHINSVIQVLVNYWELRPSQIGTRLNELLRLGVTHVTSHVPWQAVESDISHALPRFLQAVADRKMTLSLILTPEIGVNYPNSGVPKDIFTKPDNIARHAGGAQISATLPPNVFALPSLLAPEFTKRYHNFLTRMDTLLADVGRTQPQVLEGVTVVLSGSFWKYYRGPAASSQSMFGGVAGDYSGTVAVAYRQRLDQFYSQREFAADGPAIANRWKTHGLEETNRRWFYQHCEDVFRNRSMQFVRRKAKDLNLRQVEYFTPEADPCYAYSNFMQLLSGGQADFSRLSVMIEEAASRATFAADSGVPAYVHWSGLGAFQSLSDSEKQFLILKSILLMGGRGGGVLISDREWFALSKNFRARAESLARLIAHGELKLKNRALYLSPHLWSDGGILWNEMFKRLGAGARMISNADLALFAGDDRSCETDASLLVVDPSYILTRDVVMKLRHFAEQGHVVVVPRSSLFTDAARFELEEALADQATGPAITMDLGVSYRLKSAGKGKLIVYEVPEFAASGGKLQAHAGWQTFLTSVLSVAEVKSYCSVSNSRLNVIPMEKKNGGFGLFILNGSNRPIAGDLQFGGDVIVSDLAASFTGDRSNQANAVPSNRFALEVPPCGILPVAIDSARHLERTRSSQDASVAQNPANRKSPQLEDAKWN